MKYNFRIGVLLFGIVFAIGVSQAQKNRQVDSPVNTENGELATTAPAGSLETTLGPTTAPTPAPSSDPPSATSAITPDPSATTTTAAPSDSPVSTPAATLPTTPAINGGKNEVLNVQIQHILEISKTGHYIGNLEFDQMSTVLRAAGGLGPNAVEIKQHAYDKFVAYNSLRLKLEGDLASRIAVIDNYFYNENISDECKVFYHKQRRELTQAFTETNSLKSYKLMIYSETCPYKDNTDNSESAEDSDYDFWPFWGSHWFNKTLFH
ncbi:hypothetical protein ACLKA6_008741 [Drosophila palustris]